MYSCTCPDIKMIQNSLDINQNMFETNRPENRWVDGLWRKHSFGVLVFLGHFHFILLQFFFFFPSLPVPVTVGTWYLIAPPMFY